MKPQSSKSTNKYRQAKTPFEYLIQRVYVDMGSDDPCWVFTGGKDKDGYGQCHSAKTAKELGVTRAHQMSYATFNGPIPDGMFICHKCDNPSCINPSHLFLGTALDNNKDMWGKGRWVSGKKPIFDHSYIVSQHGVKDCMVLSQELGCSYSLVCQIWRAHGKTGKNWHSGNKNTV